MKKHITLIFTVFATQIALFAQSDCSEEMVWDLFYSIINANSDDVDLPEGAEASFTVNDETVDGLEGVFEIFAVDIYADNTLCIEFSSDDCPYPIITCQTGSLVDLMSGSIDGGDDWDDDWNDSTDGDWGDDWDDWDDDWNDSTDVDWGDDWDDWGDDWNDDWNDSTDGNWDDWGDDWDDWGDDWGDDWNDDWNDSTDGDWDDWGDNNDEDDYDGEGQVSSIESINSEINISLYPVPAKDNFTVEGLPEGNWEAMIFDSYGRIVSNQLISNFQRVDLSYLANGYYTIHMLEFTGISKRFVIQK